MLMMRKGRRERVFSRGFSSAAVAACMLMMERPQWAEGTWS